MSVVQEPTDRLMTFKSHAFNVFSHASMGHCLRHRRWHLLPTQLSIHPGEAVPDVNPSSSPTQLIGRSVTQVRMKAISAPCFISRCYGWPRFPPGYRWTIPICDHAHRTVQVHQRDRRPAPGLGRPHRSAGNSGGLVIPCKRRALIGQFRRIG